MIGAALIAVMALSPASKGCPAERAHYVMRGASGITAEFRAIDSGKDWPSNLVFAIHVRASGRSYWFLPWDGGTDYGQHLASTSDPARKDWIAPSPDGGPRPLGDLDYIATDRRYNVIGAAPMRGVPAPAHILLPGLGDALWHGPKPESRDSVPKQFFDLMRCS